MSHRGDVKRLVELVFRKHVVLQAVFPDRHAVVVALVRDVSGFVVADDRGQRRTEHKASFDSLIDRLLVRLDAINATDGEDLGAVAEQRYAFKKRDGRQWHRKVEFHQGTGATHSADGEGYVVAGDTHGHLHDGFHEHWIDLARHDGGTGLYLRQFELSDSASRATAHQADVAGDSGQAHGNRVQVTMGIHDAVAGCLRFEVIRCFTESYTGLLAQFAADHLAESRMGIDAGPYGRAADRHVFGQCSNGGVGAFDSIFDLGGESGEFLSKSNGRRVLHMGSTDLDDLVELPALLAKGFLQLLQTRKKNVLRMCGSGDLHRGRHRVIGGLAHVDMIVGMDWILGPDLFSCRLAGHVRDDFIYVHVGRSAGPGLIHIDGEMSHHPASCTGILQFLHDRVACPANQVASPLVELSEFLIGGRCGMLQLRECMNGLPAHVVMGDRKVQDCSLGRRAVEDVGRHLHGAHGILFDPS